MFDALLYIILFLFSIYIVSTSIKSAKRSSMKSTKAVLEKKAPTHLRIKALGNLNALGLLSNITLWHVKLKNAVFVSCFNICKKKTTAC